MGKQVDDRVVEFIEVVPQSEVPLINQLYVTTVFDTKDQEYRQVQYYGSYQVQYYLKNANGETITDLNTGDPLYKKEVHLTPYADVLQDAASALSELVTNIPQWGKDDYLKYTGKAV